MEMKRYNESLEAYDKAIELISENNSEDLALELVLQRMGA